MSQPPASNQAPAANQSEVDFCVATAKEAGQATLNWYQSQAFSVSQKADGSPLTEADLAAETLIRQRINAAFPNDSVQGEEQAATTGTSKRTWIIDPIDGTKAFAAGVPLFANLLALVDEHGLAAGVINLPALGETIWAGRGLGAHWNNEPCQVSNRQEKEGALVCTSGFGYWPQPQLHRLLKSPVRLRTWGDAYGYALVATGRAEAMIDPEAFSWDLAPIQLIIAEAGGHFTTFNGESSPDVWKSGSGFASNGHCHQQLLSLWSNTN